MVSYSTAILVSFISIRREFFCCSVLECLAYEPCLHNMKIGVYSLGLGLVQLVDLVSEIRDDRVVLLPQIGQGRLVLDVAGIVVLLQLGQLGLSFPEKAL